MLLIILLPLLALPVLWMLKTREKGFYYFQGAIAIVNIGLLLFHPIENEILDFGFGHVVFLYDKYAWLYALLVNIGFLITTIYSYSFLHIHFPDRSMAFYAWLIPVISSSLANGFAGNLFTLFIFYFLSILLTYPLLVFRKTDQAYTSGKAYLKGVMIPALVIFLPAVFILYATIGWYNFSEPIPAALKENIPLASILLGMLVIGISKNSVMPFNMWLSKTQMAPAPVTALIHSIAAVKSGSIAIIKIAVYVYGLDLIQTLTSSFWTGGYLIGLCGATAVYAAYLALKTDNLKERFSYSTVSQLSYIIIAVLVGTKTAVLGATMHIVTHSIAKINLFYIAGFYNSTYGTISARNIGKLAPYTKWIVVAIAISGASITGFPFLAGFHSKDLMLLEEIHTGNYIAALFLLTGSFINILYIYPIVKAGFFYKSLEPIEVKSIPDGMKYAILICMGLLLTFSLYSFYVIRVVQ